MNEPEVTMNDALLNSNLIATEQAIEAATEAISLVKRVHHALQLFDEVRAMTWKLLHS